MTKSVSLRISSFNSGVLLCLRLFPVMAEHSKCITCESYLEERHNLLKLEKTISTGGKIRLTSKEREVDKILLEKKFLELNRGYENISECYSSQHFFNSKNKIDTSPVFKFIQKLPKGGSLHTHLLAAVSVDYIIQNITYRDNLYGCFINGNFKLRFVQSADDNIQCSWKELKEYRKENSTFDVWLRKQLTLQVDDPHESYPTNNVIWQRFKRIFSTSYDMMCYRPVFEDYIYQLLKELYLDNVMYTELKGTFMPLYEINGTIYDNKRFFEIFVNVVEKFKKDYPKFLGVRYIHSIYRGVERDVLENGIKDFLEMKNIFPDFIVGFDLVGFEDEAKQLFDFYDILIKLRKHTKLFLHAGETNWFGYSDLNLVDAILLNSSRIGHGFTLTKHPELLKLAEMKQIAVELCPISNQVLMLNEDPRNHPAASLIALGYPIVICNDDPSIWGATGLSYDWYITFMAMTHRGAGLAVLKQFALNSITYSALSDSEKHDALDKWQTSWNIFLNEIVQENSI